MRTAAILPVKRFTHAKQRLGASVADALRRELAAAMVADVLAALAHVRAIELTVVVTSEQSVARSASEQGAIVVGDEAEAGQSAAAGIGVHRSMREGIERVLCVPGDCPALDAQELDALLSEHAREAERPGVLIVPDRHGRGTNGLLLAPPDAITTSFGPDSCARHQTLARAAGLAWRVERVPSLALDIDTGADLRALRASLSAHPDGAPRTRAVLARHTGSRTSSMKTPA